MTVFLLDDPRPERAFGDWAKVWSRHDMEHLMIDLETMGVRPGCAVIALGAVYFDPKTGELGDEFYRTSFSDQAAYGMHHEKSTVDWWAQQSDDARRLFEDPTRIQLPSLLDDFDSFIMNKKDTKVWGNGANFDNPVLAEAFHKCAKPLPWQFWNDRCYRTVKNLYPHIKLVREGVHHNALDDAKSQARHLMAIVEQTTLTLA